MKNKHVNYFNHTKQFYQFVILKKINEYGSLNMPLDVDDPELIEYRMEKALSEISHKDEFDHIIINSNFNTLFISYKQNECLFKCSNTLNIKMYLY